MISRWLSLSDHNIIHAIRESLIHARGYVMGWYGKGRLWLRSLSVAKVVFNVVFCFVVIPIILILQFLLMWGIIELLKWMVGL